MQGDNNYYDQKLAVEKLKRVYEIAPPRIRQYFRAEIDNVLSKIYPDDLVLELGCGYGRVLSDLSVKAKMAVGIDKSLASLMMGMEYLKSYLPTELIQMNAVNLAFKDNSFDLVCCIQNGISAFKVDNLTLISEAYRVTKPGGIVLISSYVWDFWIHRLEWIEIQANKGLLGEIDYNKTGNGEIVCKDGFSASTYLPEQLTAITDKLGFKSITYNIDSSSIFLEIPVT